MRRFVFLLVSPLLSEAEPMIPPVDTVSVVTPSHEPEHSGATVNHFLAQQYRHSALQQTVSLSVARMPLRKIIMRLAAYAGLSTVLESGLSGTIPCVQVRNQPIGQVLNLLLAGRTPAYAVLVVDGVLHVGQRRAIRRRAQQLLAGTVLPVESATITMVYRPWHESVKMQLEAMWHQCRREHISSSRTQYFFLDDTGHRILVQGSPEQIVQYQAMVAAFDTPIPQVRLQARVITATSGVVRNLGLHLQHNKAVLDMRIPQPDSIVSLPFVLGSRAGLQLQVCLDAAERRDRIHTLLAPMLLSSSGQQAQLLEGQRVPIESVTEEQHEGKTRTVRNAQYQEIGMQLNVTPRVLPDGQHISLDVVVEHSSVVGAKTSQSNPTIMTSRVKNKVMLRSGQTVLLGGLIRREKADQRRGIPFLSAIPFLGHLFSGCARKQEEQRLYVSMTAEVVTL